MKKVRQKRTNDAKLFSLMLPKEIYDLLDVKTKELETSKAKIVTDSLIKYFGVK